MIRLAAYESLAYNGAKNYAKGGCHVSDTIRCASATLSGLCQAPPCSKEVCGVCSYCGRPICQDHGFRSKNRFYCKAHGPWNQASYIASVVQFISRMAAEKQVSLHEISIDEVEQIIKRQELGNRQE